MKFKRLAACGIAMTVVFMAAFSGAAYAEEISADTEAAVIAADNSAGQLRDEVTGYRYKYENGHWYKRLWSYTYNRWIDPEWILDD